MTRLTFSNRWLLFALALAVCATLMIALPREYATALLWLMLAASMIASIGWLKLINKPNWIILTAFGVFAVSAYLFRPVSEENVLPLAASLMLAGWVMVGIGLWRRRSESRARYIVPLQNRLSFNRPVILAGCICLVLLAIANGQAPILPWLKGMNIHLQMALLCGGITLIAWGFSKEALHKVPSARWQRLAPILAITLLAFALRFWQLDESMRVLVHETAFAEAITVLWAQPNDIMILFPMTNTTPLPYTFAYLQMLAVEIFGRNLFGLRAASAILGALTIPALYFLAKTLFNRKIALLAALVLATFPPHLHFSRLGILEIADPFFGILALAFLARGARLGGQQDYALAGVILGMTHYFHEGGRLFYTPLALIWPFALAILTGQKPPWHGILITAGVTALVAFPIYTTLLSWDRSLTLRMDEAGVNGNLIAGFMSALNGDGNLDSYLTHFLKPLLFYVHYLDQPRIFLYYGGMQPLVLEWLVPFLLLGTGYALWRWRRPGTLLLLLWILAATIGNGLMGDVLIATRYRVVFPALAIIIALALNVLVEHLNFRRPAFIMGAVVLAIGAGQTAYYFGPHLALYNVQIRDAIWHCGDAEDAVMRAAKLPPETISYIISAERCDPDRAWQFLNFLTGSTSVYTFTPEMLSRETLESMPLDVDKAFFIEPGDRETLEHLRSYFSLESPQFSPYAKPEYRMFTLYLARSES
jgi:4-amino-4-deoxy-L-arabinose transferase-like glycosyltransferase